MLITPPPKDTGREPAAVLKEEPIDDPRPPTEGHRDPAPPVPEPRDPPPPTEPDDPEPARIEDPARGE